jgi:hypothetical protein
MESWGLVSEGYNEATEAARNEREYCMAWMQVVEVMAQPEKS